MDTRAKVQASIGLQGILGRGRLMARHGERKREDSPFQKIEKRAIEIRGLKRKEKISKIRDLSRTKKDINSDDGYETSKDDQTRNNNEDLKMNENNAKKEPVQMEKEHEELVDEVAREEKKKKDSIDPL